MGLNFANSDSSVTPSGAQYKATAKVVPAITLSPVRLLATGAFSPMLEKFMQPWAWMFRPVNIAATVSESVFIF